MGKFIGEKQPGQTRVLRNALVPDDADLLKEHDGMGTLAEILEKNNTVNPEKPYLGTRKKIVKEDGTIEFGEYEWKNFGDVHKAATAVANYLMHHELCPKIQTDDGEFRFMALYAKNRAEWTESDLGAMLAGITIVTLYDTLGKDSMDYILEQTSIKTIVCSADKIKNLVDLKKEGKLNKMTHVIYFDKADAAISAAAAQNGLTLINYEDVQNEGKGLKVKLDQVTPETVYTLCYTSGTTGMPKGAMLTHRNFVSNIANFTKFDGCFKLYPDDVYISYLPLAHVFERFLMTACMAFQI